MVLSWTMTNNLYRQFLEISSFLVKMAFQDRKQRSEMAHMIFCGIHRHVIINCPRDRYLTNIISILYKGMTALFLYLLTCVLFYYMYKLWSSNLIINIVANSHSYLFDSTSYWYFSYFN